MTIGTVTYPTPITVRGFSCRTCSDVDLATRDIDPQHPRSGAGDVDALSDPTRSQADKAQIAAHRKTVSAGETPAYRRGGGPTLGAGVIGATIDLAA